MIRRYNYTGRKTLPHKIISIEVKDDHFTASWRLDGFVFPGNARVYVEAFTSGSPEVLRFPCGTIAEPDTASTRDISKLATQNIAFNLKVVDESEYSGRLLGVSTNIKPADDGDAEGGQQSILPVNPVDLEQQVWQLNFSHERPWLEVNNRIPDIMRIAKEDRQFFSLVYPSVIRQILTRILVVEEFDDPDAEPGNWRVQWLKWGIHWHPDKERPESGNPENMREEWLMWIERVVGAFCKTHQVCSKFLCPDGKEEC